MFLVNLKYDLLWDYFDSYTWTPDLTYICPDLKLLDYLQKFSGNFLKMYWLYNVWLCMWSACIQVRGQPGYLAGWCSRPATTMVGLMSGFVCYLGQARPAGWASRWPSTLHHSLHGRHRQGDEQHTTLPPISAIGYSVVIHTELASKGRFSSNRQIF